MDLLNSFELIHINSNSIYLFQNFETLNERWPMACGSQAGTSQKHLYTVPWSFEQLNISMLARNDTASVCPNVRKLTVDVPCNNLSHRFPNVHTVTILSEENLSRDDCAQFSRLHHLITTNINMVPFPARHIHTLTLFKTNDLLTHLTVHSNVQHLTLETNEITPLTIVRTLVQQFPNLHSLQLNLTLDDEYYDSLDVLLDNENLSNLSSLKTNWINDDRSNIQI
jgi:hypothetical protein